jgi:hypothetical protein
MIINFTLHVNNLEKINLGFIIYENKKIVRFTNFNPIHNSEGFFKNILS